MVLCAALRPPPAQSPVPAPGVLCRGLHQLIRPEWVRMFNEEELQVCGWGRHHAAKGRPTAAHHECIGECCSWERGLAGALVLPCLPIASLPPIGTLLFLQMLISGGQQGLDIADMRAHCQYSGGYHEDHPVVAAFWAALATFTPAEQAAFLRFVTSCPRPPLLGFKYLEPPLGIQVELEGRGRARQGYMRWALDSEHVGWRGHTPA